MEPSKIVARFQDGRIVKGHTQNFFPNKPVFHLTPQEGQTSGSTVEITVAELKAVFFVRDFAGDRAVQERTTLAPGEKATGRLLEVTFRDGEKLVGTTSGYDPKRPGFFLFPIDTEANNIKAYVVAAAVQSASFL
jgi:hypothetical protein